MHTAQNIGGLAFLVKLVDPLNLRVWEIDVFFSLSGNLCVQ